MLVDWVTIGNNVIKKKKKGGGANLGSTRCQVPLEFATTSGILGPLLQGRGE